MSESSAKVEFAVGSQVSMGQFFKSSFARSFVTNCRDSQSLNFDLNESSINDDLKIICPDNTINNRPSLPYFNGDVIQYDNNNIAPPEKVIYYYLSLMTTINYYI